MLLQGTAPVPGVAACSLSLTQEHFRRRTCTLGDNVLSRRNSPNPIHCRTCSLPRMYWGGSGWTLESLQSKATNDSTLRVCAVPTITSHPSSSGSQGQKLTVEDSICRIVEQSAGCLVLVWQKGLLVSRQLRQQAIEPLPGRYCHSHRLVSRFGKFGDTMIKNEGWKVVQPSEGLIQAAPKIGPFFAPCFLPRTLPAFEIGA